MVLLHDLECTFYMQTNPIRNYVKILVFTLLDSDICFYTNPPTQNFVHVMMWRMLLIVPLIINVIQLISYSRTATAYLQYKDCVCVAVCCFLSTGCVCVCVWERACVLCVCVHTVVLLCERLSEPPAANVTYEWSPSHVNPKARWTVSLRPAELFTSLI